ncbi:hypothetical protein [Arthrobacter castelli]|uniref:hypothetical protein n=1 Tax=Arthrobacter castelli TaxID=271431 RepID=UPI00047E670D|nr:hypothetical protein [Arthrobacter castelli]
MLKCRVCEAGAQRTVNTELIVRAGPRPGPVVRQLADVLPAEFADDGDGRERGSAGDDELSAVFDRVEPGTDD